MKTNPFEAGVTVSGDNFFDRKKIGEELHYFASEGKNVLLYAPRRYGKSSLVKIVAERLRAEGHPCIYFDMMTVDSMEDFLSQYAAAVYEVKSRLEKGADFIKSFFAGLRPNISIGEDGETTFSIDFTRTGSHRQESFSKVLSLTERLAKDLHVVVIFDEFQEIAHLAPNAEGLFRSVIQHQRKTSYIFLGSKTHLLKRMFAAHQKPFYNSAEMLAMEKPPVDESRDFLISRFKAGGANVGATHANRIVQYAENIPYYIQALAGEVFKRVTEQGRRTVSPDDIDRALFTLVERKRDLFETTIENLSRNQRELLRALAKEPTDTFSAAYRARHALGVYSTLASSLKTLVEKGLVESEHGRHSLGDPLLRTYLVQPAYLTH